jgi:hypothetical protein
MQINSAQDYLTLRKRQLVAKSFYTTPPEQKDKTNSVYLSTVANNATVRQVLHVPAPSGWGDAPGGITVTNWCTGDCSGSLGAPGTFQVVNRKDLVSRQALRPIGIRSTTTAQ